jgi:hypothetical protein
VIETPLDTPLYYTGLGLLVGIPSCIPVAAFIAFCEMDRFATARRKLVDGVRRIGGGHRHFLSKHTNERTLHASTDVAAQ